MRIEKLKLENIKCFSSKEFDFASGINFIGGKNGRGKTTIIESIGFALFDKTPEKIKKSQLIKYGCKSGSIEIHFSIGDKNFRLKRDIKSNGGDKRVVYDETGMIDIEGVKDFNAWFKSETGLEGDVPDLFRNIIGVEQGAFTAPFMLPDGARNEHFEKIFGVRQYRNAAEKAGGARKLLEKELSDVRDDIKVLEGRLGSKAEKLEQKTAAEASLAEKLSKMRVIEEKLTDAQNKYNNYEQLYRDIEKNKNLLSQSQIILNSLAENIRTAESELENCKKAYTYTIEHKEAYSAYLSLEKQLLELETKRNERDILQKAVSKTMQDLNAVLASIEAKEKHLMETDKKLNGDISLCIQRLDNAVKPLNNALTACNEAKSSLDGITKQIRDSECSNVKLQELSNSIAAVYALRSSFASNCENILAKQAILASLPLVEKDLRLLEECEEQRKAKIISLESVKREITLLTEDAERASDGLCPYAGVKCETIKGGLSSLLDKKIKSKKEDLENYTADISVLDGQHSKLTYARDRIIELNSEKKALASLKAENASMEKSFADWKKDFIASRFNEAFDHDALLETYAKLIALLGAADALQVLPLKLDSYYSDIKKHKDDALARLWKERESINERHLAASAHLSKLERGKESIEENLKKYQQELKNLESTRSEIERERNKANDMNDECKKRNSRLLEYSGLDDEHKKLRTGMEKHNEGYTLYISNINNAEKLPGTEGILKQLQKNLADENQNKVNINAKLKDMQERYSEQDANLAKAELDDLTIETVTLKADLEHLRSSLESIEKELGRIKNWEDDLTRKIGIHKDLNSRLSLLENVIRLFRAAGERIASGYRAKLEHRANELYRQVSSSGATLYWTNDYDIKLCENIEGHTSERFFRQLSGGEQMTAALAIRISMLQEFSRANIGFFDEPTTNLDPERRFNFAQYLPTLFRNLEQCFIISHDDTFDSISDNIIHVE